MHELVEREAEAAALADLVRAAAAGDGGAVLIEGEAGIGKTSLLAIARARAVTAGLRVLSATADEIEAQLPLACARVLLARATRSLAADGPAQVGLLALRAGLAEPGGPGSRADEVVHGLWWLIAELCDERPLALLVDDAQWADELTLRLLRLTARRASELPLALVVAARSGPLAAERAFLRLEPARLTPAGTARLVQAVLGEPGPAAVHELTRGNPLYVRELIAPGLESLRPDRPPPQMVRLVADRLHRLTPAAAALARACAVLGADADPGRARRLAGLEPAAALAAEAELRAERVLEDDAFAFAHPLVAAAAREGIDPALAGELHRRAAELLDDDGRVAEHLLRAPARGDERAVATLRRAADQARRVGAAAAAARLLERALAEPPEPGVLAAVEFEHGRALLEAGDPEGARRLADVARRGGDPSLRAGAARQLARRLALNGQSDEAAAVLHEAVAALPADERETRLELLVEEAFLGSARLAGHAEARRAIAEEAARARGRTPAERLVMVAAHVLAGEAPGDPVHAATRLLELRLHRDYPGGFAVGTLTFSAVAMLLNADAPDAAERAMDALRADAVEMAIPDVLAGALWQQAQIAYHRGDLARCELEARAVIEAGGEFAVRLAAPWLVLVRTEQGRLREAGELLEEAGMLGRLPQEFPWTEALGSRGRLRLAQADARRAVEDLTEARDRSATWFPQRVEPPWRPLLVEALVLAGDTGAAAAEAEVYAALAAHWGTRRALGHAARLRALTAARPRAIALLEEARDHFAAAGARLELARCVTELGAHRRAAGERVAARAILRDAHALALRCGADALAERARAELLLAGGRPRPPAGAGAAALTPAERRVSELAAEGATNREIARRLFLSPKTVEMHLRATYRKLGIRGRDELPGALA